MRTYSKPLAIFLAAALLLTTFGACGGNNGGTSEKGRYVEETLGEDIAVTGGSVSYEAGMLRWMGEQDGTYASYIQETEKGDANAQPIAWLNDLIKDGGSVSSVSEAPDGTAYAIYTDKDNKASVAKSVNDQTAALIPMDDWTTMGNMRSQTRAQTNSTQGGQQARSGSEESRGQGSGPSTNVRISGPGGSAAFDPSKSLVPQGITALDNGFLVSFMMQGVVQYDAEGKEVRKYAETASSGMGFVGGGMGSGLTVFETTMAWPDTQKGEILLFNLADGKLTERVAYEGLDSATYIGLDANGLFVADGTGISRWENGVWKLVVDGSLTMLIMPNIRIAGVISGENGDWYAFLTGQDNNQLLRFRFDPDIPAQPSKTLTIFSLYDNTTARLAIAEFQRKNADVRVTMEVGIETNANAGMLMGPGPGAGGASEQADNSATVEDVIRALNTQLLAGKGPDLIILDGLPLQSYIEKGVLKDISALTQRLTSEENLLANLTGAYTFDGKVYGLPSRFSLPVMIGDSEQLKGLNSSGDLVKAVKAYGSKEPALMRAPDQLWEETGLIMSSYDACVGEFTNKDGSLNEAGLAQYLSDALELTDAMREIYPEANQRGNRQVAFAAVGGGGARRIDSGAMNIANGEALIHLQNFENAMGFMMVSTQLGSMDDMEIASLFRKGYYTPVGGIGVVAASKQQTLAEEFIQTLVGSVVQENFMADAFPVNRTAWSTMIKEFEERLAEAMDVEEFNDMGFTALCESLSTPLFVDQFVKNAVQLQAKAIVKGTVTPEEAAAKIVAGTRLYLAE